MGLIINKKIQMLMKGYPTVSDKYNIAGGTLTGNTPVEFGELVKFSGTKGYYEAITNTVTVNNIAGFVVATNVKLADGFPGTTVKTMPGEAFNLLVNGFIAIELAASAKEEDITPNSVVKVTLADGTLTTSSVSDGTATLPSVVFTGTYEKHGTTLYAEIYVK